MKKSNKDVEKNKKKVIGPLILLTISLDMLVLTTLCAAKEEIEEDLNRVNEAYQNFSGACNEVLDNDQKGSDGIIRTGKKFLNELNKFNKLPEAKDKDIQNSLGSVKEMTRDAISKLS